MMTDFHADALVYFGMTDGFAPQPLFPALQAMIRSGDLNVPILRVAQHLWSIDQMRAHGYDRLEQHGDVDEAAFAQMSSQLRCISENYQDAATFAALRRILRDAAHPLYDLAIPAYLFAPVVRGLVQSGCAADAHVVLEKPFTRGVGAKKVRRYL